jgi:hypothetical protein
MHITGDEIAVINVVIGGVLGWSGGAWSQWRSSRIARLDARSDRCRDAYAALILTFDHLVRALDDDETLALDERIPIMGEVTEKSLHEVNQAYVMVLLAGSNEARPIAREAQNAVFDLNTLLQGPSDKVNQDEFDRLLTAVGDVTRSFVHLAERELA